MRMLSRLTAVLPEGVILVADPKNRGRWGRECDNNHTQTLPTYKLHCITFLIPHSRLLQILSYQKLSQIKLLLQVEIAETYVQRRCETFFSRLCTVQHGRFHETFLNFCCETSFTKSRTAFYFCNGRNDHSGDKNNRLTV